MFKRHFYFLLIIITLMALALRIYQIGQVPHGMTWDEAAIGYNGWSIMTTHRDEWLHLMPISFKSFGDYKAPLAIYLNGLFTGLFGLKLWIVRLPFVIAGAFAVFGIGLMIRQLLLILIGRKWWQEQKSPSIESFALLASFSLTISPWHFHFSRLGFESGLALTEIIWALYFFFVANADLSLKQCQRKNQKKIMLYFFSWLLFALSLYTYHSTKLFTPLLIIALVFVGWRWLKIAACWLFWGGVSFLIFLLPLIYDAIYGHGLERAGVTLFSKVPGLGNQLRLLLTNLMIQLSPQFLLLGKTDTLRHGGLPFSVLLPGTLLIILIGLVLWLYARSHWSLMKKLDKLYLFSFYLVFIGLLPAAIGLIVPHANRALLALIGFILLLIIGWLSISFWFKLKKWPTRWLKFIVISWLFLQLGFFSIDVYQYFTVFAKNSAPAFNDGYRQMMTEAIKYEKGLAGYPEVKKIVITSEYGQPYIYALFMRRTSPIAYHGGSLIKYDFPDVVHADKLSEKNALVVAGKKADLIDKTRAAKVIYNSAGQPVFWLFVTKK